MAWGWSGRAPVRAGGAGRADAFPGRCWSSSSIIAVGVVLWLENRGQVRLTFLSVHVTAPLWVVAVANLVLGLILGGLLVARSRR